jgi:hypothetical protein
MAANTDNTARALDVGFPEFRMRALANKSLRRTPDAPVTRLACATGAPAAGAAELQRYAALKQMRKGKIRQ